MILRSNGAYDASGRHLLEDPSEELAICDGDKCVGTITVMQLVRYLKECRKKGVRHKYTNVLGTSYIFNEDRKANAQEYVFVLEKDGHWGRISDEIASVDTVGQNNMVIRFKNGFTICIYHYIVTNYGDEFDTVSFQAFDSKETFSLGEDFAVLVCITKYSQDAIKGRLSVFQCDFSNDINGRYQGGTTTLGVFELRRDGTTYRGEELGYVSDERRLTKELVLR